MCGGHYIGANGGAGAVIDITERSSEFQRRRGWRLNSKHSDQLTHDLILVGSWLVANGRDRCSKAAHKTISVLQLPCIDVRSIRSVYSYDDKRIIGGKRYLPQAISRHKLKRGG